MTGRTRKQLSSICRIEIRSAMTQACGILPLEYMPTPPSMSMLMEGKPLDEHTFRQKCQIVTLGTRSSIKIDGEEAQVDPQPLFQRVIIIAQTSDELWSTFQHELCSYPPTLFNSSLLLREAHKPALADAICLLLASDLETNVRNKDSRYVLDGGGGGHSFSESHGLADIHTYASSINVY